MTKIQWTGRWYGLCALVGGVDVTTALEADMIETTDAEHLEFAAREGRVLYSFNVGDFYRLHTLHVQRGKHHGGIILSRQQEYAVGEQMRRLLRLITGVSADEMEDRVEFLSSWG